MAAMDTKEVLGFLQLRMRDLHREQEAAKYKVITDIMDSPHDTLDDYKDNLHELEYAKDALCEVQFLYDIIAGKDARKDYFASVSEEDKELYGLTNL
jgi:hypothetical protein